MKKLVITICLVIVLSECLLVYGNENKNTEINFKIVSFKGVWKQYSDNLYIIGEVKNIGSKAAGVKLEVIARDCNGILVGSQQFWPNSTDNIQPGRSCGIDYPITTDKSAKTLEVKIIKTIIW